MKIFVIGSGGREHAIVWKIVRSKRVTKIFCAPGNAGIASLAECVDIPVDNIAALADFAQKNAVDLTVVGPELPLTLGIVDLFASRGLRIFGPSKAAAVLEASKVFSKELMKKYAIPTAQSRIFNLSADAREYLGEISFPVVIKADGLCAGKGVIIAEDRAAAEKAITDILDKKMFGAAGKEIVIEEFLRGEEVSVLAFSDGETVRVMPPSQDHKRIFDGDKGPNTGGMGVYSPVSVIQDSDIPRIEKEILLPTVQAMKKEGRRYVGVLYAGLMITAKGPKVLEYNVRFGDPETQAVLPRIANDLVDLIEHTVSGTLDKVRIEVSPEAAVCVVAASGGYPGDFKKGLPIVGLDAAAKLPGATVFHAGTKSEDGRIVTAGGRVLGVTAVGKDLRAAIDRAYEACSKISFDGIYYRKDIGKKGLKRMTNDQLSNVKQGK
ncbi:MAG TPA: phosphoribosylamine--glycine ligase [bacterium]|nr:phosphoribosylamine--glycine ligase [bacterium]